MNISNDEKTTEKYVSIHPSEAYGSFSSGDQLQDGFRTIACELLPKHPLDKEQKVIIFNSA